MIEIEKTMHKCYCTSCGKPAKHLIMINDPRIIQKSKDALCNTCLNLLYDLVSKYKNNISKNKKWIKDV